MEQERGVRERREREKQSGKRKEWGKRVGGSMNRGEGSGSGREEKGERGLAEV